MPTDIWKYTTAIGLAIILFSMLGYGLQPDNNSNASVNEPVTTVPTPTPTQEDQNTDQQTTVDETPTQEEMDQALQEQQEEDLNREDKPPKSESEYKVTEPEEVTEDTPTEESHTTETPVVTPTPDTIKDSISLKLTKMVCRVLGTTDSLNFGSGTKVYDVTWNGKDYYLIEKK
jgi:hypothetical protein